MVVFLLIVLVIEIAILGWWINRRVEVSMEYTQFTHSALVKKLDEVQGEVKKKGSVTPPIVAANKTHTPGASSSHIIIRKTPDQIRAENAEAIRSGAVTYGRPTE